MPRQLPGVASHLVTRKAQHQLDGLLDQVGRASCAVVISGTAGVGKTALAVQWAHRAADRFPDGQLYVNLNGFDPSGAPVPAELAIRGFLDALQVPPDMIPAGSAALTALYRTVMADRAMLVVLDNARNADQVRPLLPGSPGCLTVVTSRSQMLGLITAEGACPLPLEVLTRPEAYELLTRRLGIQRVMREPDAVNELIDLCARLPLAMNIAAARSLARPALPLATLAAGLRDTPGPLEALETGDPATSPRSVFSWSYRSLSDPAARLFSLLGMHVGPHISVQAAASLAGVPAHEASRQLDELARAGLLEEPAHGRFAFHDLLRAFAAEQAAVSVDGAQRRVAMRRLLDHYLHTAYAADRVLNDGREPLTVPPAAALVVTAPPGDPAQSLAWFESEHRGLVTAIDNAASAGFDTHAWQLAWSLVTFYDRRGFWDEWAATQNVALAATRRQGDRNAEALAHRNAGRAYQRLRSYPDADRHLHQGLSILRQLSDRVGQARILQDIGQSLCAQGRYQEALERDLEGLDLFRAENHPGGQANLLNAIGCDLAELGRYGEAVTYCQQALVLCRETGLSHGEVATLDSLGYAYQQLGQFAQAMSYYQEALDLNREVGDSWGQAVILDRVGDLHHMHGEDGRACQAWRQAGAILDELKHSDADQIHEKVQAAEGDLLLRAKE